MGKRFIVCPLRVAYARMCRFDRPTMYEVIKFPLPIKMYFDIERSFDEDEVTDERASALSTFIYVLLKRWATIR